MNFFSIKFVSKPIQYIIVFLFFMGLFTACTTYKTQLGSQATSFYNNQSLDTTTIVYSVFLTGNAANTQNDGATPTLSNFKKRLEAASKNSTVLFLGDNVFPVKGISENRSLGEDKLFKQLQLTDKFKGNVYFIPGDFDWGKGLKDLKIQEDFITQKSKKTASVIPQKGCGIEVISLSPTVELVALNSQWLIEDWDKHPEINFGCSVKTKEQLFEDLDDLLRQNPHKTVLLATHHPLLSNGVYGGQYSLRDQIFPLEKNIPLPIIGSFYNLYRKASGTNPMDLQHVAYKEMNDRIKSIVQKYQNVVVVSGHEQNLQYINKEGIQQIISGSGAHFTEARTVNPKDFSYGGNGYAVVDIFANGASTVSYYTTSNRKEVLLFKQKISEPESDEKHRNYPKPVDSEIKRSVFGRSVSRKSDIYQFLWGKHYKSYYKQNIVVQTATLDTLLGGLKPLGFDTENTTTSLLTSDKNGREYIITPLQKDASSFFKSIAYRNDAFSTPNSNTLSEDFLRDYFTTIHPYIPLIIPTLSQAINVTAIPHKLYHIPNQNSLGKYNSSFGDQFYYVAPKANTTQKNNIVFGKPSNIIDTDEMLHLIRTNKNHEVDQVAYIRARLFDMLIGDWDKQAKNWRWAVFQEKNKVIYKPIPINRDQAFAKYDGAFLKLLKTVPEMGQMHSYSYNYPNPKKFNAEVYALDLALLASVDEKLWKEQAQYIQEHLTNDIINKAFLELPYELQDETTSKLKLYLRNRLKKLPQIAKNYQKIIDKKVVIVGTHDNDVFVINRNSNGQTTVAVYNGKKIPANLIFERTFSKKQTREIWLFGLEGKDEFSMEGKESNVIKIRLIGGLNQDSYVVENGKKVKIHDFISNSGTIQKDSKTTVLLSNDYETNTYNYKRPKFNSLATAPVFGFNPDDGMRVGIRFDFTQNGFTGQPYSQKHRLQTQYYFATQGYDLAYNGLIKKAWGKYDLVLDASATSSNFVQNFFGFGNETTYDTDIDFDYNRVRMSSYKVSPGLVWHKTKATTLTARAYFEAFQVENTPNRFISETPIPNRVFDFQPFAGIGLSYLFKNYDNAFVPSLGMAFQADAQWTVNASDFTRQIPSASASLNLVYKLTPNKEWIFETTLQGTHLFSDHFEFYQAAFLGGDTNLRGFRDNRFAGKASFYQGSDLRYFIGQIKNPFAPINYGAFIGFDYGRVWFPEEISNRWHQSTGFGVWMNSSNVISSTLSYFHSSDGGRIAFGMKFNF
ncbi:metallophosphoesterase [Flavobacterium sp.]|uniref:metallophosphoesterase n=1 Tax=Flavobacterium sp. TaxID=239 RepID=UPI002FDAB188